MMKRCRENGWSYLFTQKESRQKAVGETYEWIRGGSGEMQKEGVCREKETGAYVNDVEETTGKEETMNLYGYEYE